MERGNRMKTIKGSELADRELEVLEDGTLRLIKTKVKRFIPSLDEEYWHVSHYGDIVNMSNDGYIQDSWLINHHLVFGTKKECEEYKEFLELLDEYKFKPDWSDCEQDKYYLLYNNQFNEINIGTINVVNMQGVFYFKSRTDAQEFIGKVGKDNIKRFMFDMWE